MSPDGCSIQEVRKCSHHHRFIQPQPPGPQIRASVPLFRVTQVIYGSRFFTTLDAIWGYLQLPLDEPSQHLMTFITPWGRYRFLMEPMGFISTDEFCRRGNLVLEGIDNCAKVVDDVLVWDVTFKAHLQHVHQILERFREHRLSINKKKFVFGAAQVSYCG